MDEEATTSGAPLGFRAGSKFGNYRLKRLLGKGGFGYVWQAEDTVMDRVVALKLLRSEYSENESFRQRLFREARAAGRLHEPHVVPIHQCGEIDGQIYIDMRLVDGTDLEAVLSQHGPLSPARAVSVVRQIAAALDAAHSAGLVHRDVKPANILLTADDFACLVDFGLANAASDAKLTSTGITIGTLAYIAPERLSADAEIDHRADVYALACVLYESLTGSRPYSGDMPALISAHLTAPIPQPSQQRPDIPSAFDDVVACGMAKAATDRYPSAGDLARAAQLALTGRVQVQADTIAASTQAPTVLAQQRMSSLPATDLPTEHASVEPGVDSGVEPRLTIRDDVQPNSDADLQRRGLPAQRGHPRAIAIAFAVPILGLAVAIAIFATLNHSRTSAERSASSPRSSATSITAPPVGESALDGLLLSPDQISAAIGNTGMTPRGRGPLADSAITETNPPGCRAPITEEAHTYAGSGSTTNLDEQLWDAKATTAPTHIVDQAVALFPSAEKAAAFFDASVSQWTRCANRSISTTYSDGRTGSSTTGPVSNSNGVRSITFAEGTMTGQHALTIANNVIIDVSVGDVSASDKSGGDEAVRIASEIAAKVAQ